MPQGIKHLLLEIAACIRYFFSGMGADMMRTVPATTVATRMHGRAMRTMNKTNTRETKFEEAYGPSHKGQCRQD